MDLELIKSQILDASNAYREEINCSITGQITYESYQRYLASKKRLAEKAHEEMIVAIDAMAQLSENDLSELNSQPQVREAISWVIGYKKRNLISTL